MEWGGVAICHRNTFTNLKDNKIGKATVRLSVRVSVRVRGEADAEGGDDAEGHSEG